MSSAAPRLPYLDALRGYAILGVVIVHVEQKGQLSSSLAETYAQHGRYGVQLFFLVSAVSIAMAWHARADGFLRFIIRRLFRLLPALTLAAIGYATVGGMHPEWWQAALTLSFLNGWHPSVVESAVPGSWTLSAEMTFYLSVPILAVCVRSLWSAVIWILCAQIIAMKAGPSVWAFWDKVNPGGIGYVNQTYFWISPLSSARWFLLGWTIYLVLQRFTLKFPAREALLGVAIACLALAPLLGAETRQHDFVLLFGIPALVYAMSQGAGVLLDNAPMRWLGTISYSMYLWHFAVVWKLAAYLDKPSFSLLLTSTLAITILFASITYLLIERPAIRLGGALLRRRDRRAASPLDADGARDQEGSLAHVSSDASPAR